MTITLLHPILFENTSLLTDILNRGSLLLDFGRSTQELYKDGTEKLEEIKNQFFRLLPFWLAGSLTALIATQYAKLFSLMESYSLLLLEKTGAWFIFVPPIFFLISWALVYKFAHR